MPIIAISMSLVLVIDFFYNDNYITLFKLSKLLTIAAFLFLLLVIDFCLALFIGFFLI